LIRARWRLAALAGATALGSVLAFEDLRFLIVLLFPGSIGAAGWAVSFIRLCTSSWQHRSRRLLRVAAYTAAGVLVSSVIVGFVSWWRGFAYLDTDSGTPQWMDDALDVTSSVALMTSVMLIAGCLAATRHQPR